MAQTALPPLARENDPVQPAAPEAAAPAGEQMSMARNFKFGLFHLGSGMADVITTGVWNRIMISDLGFAATPIGLLVALRYFLAPIGVWVGAISDRRALLGFHRLFWIWLGRGMMAASIAALGLVTAHVADGAAADAGVWLAIALSLLLFSLGNAFSGGTFLALLYDRSSAAQRGRVVGVVWTFLLLGFMVGGIVFGLLLPGAEAGVDAGEAAAGPGYTVETLRNLFLIGAAVLGTLWLIALLGEERRNSAPPHSQAASERTAPLADLRVAWHSPHTRAFFWFLGLSMLFAFSQDLILEPFGAEVFGMDAGITTRFATYWGSMAILGTVVFLFLGRRFKRLSNTVMSYIGVGALVLTFAVFAFASAAQMRPLVTPGLIFLGIGLGIWNVGTLGLMIDMSPAGRAGTFLGFWTLVVTLARGLGVSGGGVLRDLALRLGMTPDVAYAVVFALGALGLIASLLALRGVNVAAFKAEHQPQSAAAGPVLAAGLD
jgi:BCD family chlorophyll transporter-like MFS transporter